MRIWRERTRRIGSEERGVALPMVLLVFVVGVALIAAFLVSIVGSSQVTTAAKADVQAQAAAEAGIAAIYTEMLAADDLCELPAIESPAGEVPEYTASVTGCDDSAFTVTVRSTGIAPNGQRQTVEAVYPLEASPSQSPPVALRTGKNTVLASDTKIRAVDPAAPANLFVESGNFTCTAGAKIEGSVYVLNGGAELSGACPIGGDLYAKGDIVINGSGRVFGDAVSVSGNVTLSGGARVDGSVYAAGNLVSGVQNGIGGNAHVGGNASFSGATPSVLGTLKYGGVLSGSTAFVAGGPPVKAAAPSLSMPHPPVWVDLSMDTITDAGFALQPWQSGWECSPLNWGSPVGLSAWQTYTSPKVIDARDCASGFNFEYWGYELKLRTDLVIVATSFNLRGFKISSGDGQPHKLWLVVLPPKTCPAASDIKLDSIDFVGKKITALAYSPCDISMGNSGAYWHGAIFSGSFSGTPLFDYSYIGLPGQTTSGGPWGGGDPTLASDRAILQRNVDTPDAS